MYQEVEMENIQIHIGFIHMDFGFEVFEKLIVGENLVGT